MSAAAANDAAVAVSAREIDLAVTQVAPDRRARTLEQVTNLFVMHAPQLSDSEIAVFDDVISRLAADIEVEARILLAQRLATVPNAPLNTIRMLAFDDHVAVAAPVLVHSEQIDEASLVEIARTRSQSHLFAISRREALAEPVTDILVARGDRSVAISVVENAGARLSEMGFLSLIRRAEGDDALAERLGERSEIPAHLFLRLLAVASERVRTRLRGSHPQAGAEIDRVVEQVTGRIRRAAAAPHDYADRMEHLGDRYIAGRLGEIDLARFARGRHFEDTVVTLALLAKVPVSVVDRAMQSERPDVILVIARAAGLGWGTTKLVLQLRAGSDLLSSEELQRDLAEFEQLNPSTAAHLVRFQAMSASEHRDKRM
jgi:uncharacterized protein (DUF2336 family)